jgi:short subunit dehydrogenase-like uncharacterized protein
MSGAVLVYGATGFSGRAIAAGLLEAGHNVVLGGRDAGRLEGVARSLRSPWRALDLRDPGSIRAGLAGIALVLHCAGPFVDTAPPMMAACVEAGAHYLDLAGEWPVFALAQRLGPSAAAAGVMLMPGVGSTIVVSDCLMAAAVAAVPEARALRVAGSFPPIASRGSVRSGLGLVAGSVIVRRAGVVGTAPLGAPSRWFNFGDGERPCLAVSGAEVITGQQTTGVANIEAYMEAPFIRQLAFRAGGLAADLSGGAAARVAGRVLAAAWPERPSDAVRRRASNAVVVETEDPWRRTRRFGVRTPDGYSVTVASAGAIAGRVLAGEHRPGFQTPAGAFGAALLDRLGLAEPFDASPFAITEQAPRVRAPAP